MDQGSNTFEVPIVLKEILFSNFCAKFLYKSRHILHKSSIALTLLLFLESNSRPRSHPQSQWYSTIHRYVPNKTIKIWELRSFIFCDDCKRLQRQSCPHLTHSQLIHKDLEDWHMTTLDIGVFPPHLMVQIENCSPLITIQESPFVIYLHRWVARMLFILRICTTFIESLYPVIHIPPIYNGCFIIHHT